MTNEFMPLLPHRAPRLCLESLVDVYQFVGEVFYGRVGVCWVVFRCV